LQPQQQFLSQIRPGKRKQRVASVFAWRAGRAAGSVASLLCAGIVVALLLSGTFRLRERVAAALPREIVDLFEKPSPPSPVVVAAPQKLAGAASKGVKELAPPAAERKTFGMASTKEEVIAAQGNPVKISGNTWYYGASEVYFVGERVAGWRDSSERSLRLR
jgi:hypothetical protein